MKTSQIGQDDWVLTQLHGKRDGVFVDVGAFDGYTISNTYVLEKEYGWTGVCVEPNPSAFEHLCINRDCAVIEAAVVGKANGQVRFKCNANPVLSAVDVQGDTSVDTITLNKACELAGDVIDYISLDTEGSEWDILQGFDDSVCMVNCWTIEHNNGPNLSRIVQWLMDRGYLWRVHKHDVFAVRDRWVETR